MNFVTSRVAWDLLRVVLCSC